MTFRRPNVIGMIAARIAELFQRQRSRKTRSKLSTRTHTVAGEVLEDRCLLAAFIVDTLVDESDGNFGAGDFTLREAIEQSNSTGSVDDTITFDASLMGGTIELSAGELSITDTVTITGLGSEQLTISGDLSSRVFSVVSGDVKIAHLAIADGVAQGGKGGSSEFGGGGGGGAGLGGGIFVNSGASVVVQNLIFSNNRAIGGDGGDAGVPGAGTTTVSGGFNSTGGVGGTSSFVDGTFGVGGAGGSGTTVASTAGGNGSVGNFAAGGGGGGGGGFDGSNYVPGSGGDGGTTTDAIDDVIGGRQGTGDGQTGWDGLIVDPNDSDNTIFDPNSSPGTGGGGGGGAGLGGAIFVRSGGSLTIVDTHFEKNQAIGGQPGRRGESDGVGLGGSVFASDGVTVNHFGTTFGFTSERANFDSAATLFPSNPATSLERRQGLQGTFTRTLPSMTYMDGPTVPAFLEFSYLNPGVRNPFPVDIEDMDNNVIGQDRSGGTKTTVSEILERLGRGGLREEVASPTAIALTSIDTSNGQWLLNGVVIENVSESNALLLIGTDELAFEPKEHFASYSRDVQPRMTFRAWDETGGNAGDRVDTTTNGGGTPFSTTIATAVVDISDPIQFNNPVPLYGDTATFVLPTDTYTTQGYAFSQLETSGSSEFDYTVTGVGGLWASGEVVSSRHAVINLDRNVGSNYLYGYSNRQNGVLQFASTSAFVDNNIDTAESLVVSQSIFNANVRIGNFVAAGEDSGPIPILRSKSALDNSVTHFKVTNLSSGTLYKDAAFTQAVADGEFISYGNGVVWLYFRPDAAYSGDVTFRTQDSTAGNDAGLVGADNVAAPGEASNEIVFTQNDGSATHIKVTSITDGTVFLDSALTQQVTNGTFVAYDSGSVSLFFSPDNQLRTGTGSFMTEETTTGDDAGLLGGPLTTEVTILSNHKIEVINSIIQISRIAESYVEEDSGTRLIDFVVSRGSVAGDLPAATYGFAVTSANMDGTEFVGGAFPTGTVSFAAGQTQAIITVEVLADEQVEFDETFTVTLDSLPMANFDLSQIAATVTIANDDIETFDIVADAMSMAEGNSVTTDFTFTVTRTHDTGTSTIDFAVSGAVNASDFGGTLPSGTLTFLAGETEKTITIQVSGDSTVELDETFTVTLSNPSGAAVLGTASAMSTITNDDMATVTIDDPMVNEDTGTLTFTLTLDNPVDGGFSVDFSTSDNTATTADGDYTAVANQTVTFAGTAGETETVTVTLTSDAKVEIDEVIDVALSNIVAGTVDNSDIDATDTATGTILNDDMATVTINDPTVNEDDGTLTFTLTLDNAVDGGFDVDFSTADGTATTADGDYTPVTNQTVTFAGTAGETETVIVTIGGDTKVEADETIVAALSNLVPVTVASSDIDITDTGTGTLTNDDSASVTVSDVAANENDGTLTFTLILNNTVDGGFDVDFSTSDNTATTADSDYTAVTNQTVTFAGSASESETVTVTLGGDTKVEADEVFAVALSNLVTATVDASDIDITDGAIGTITNDDSATVTMSDPVANEDDGTLTFTLTLDNAVDGGFDVDFSTFDNTATTADSDYTAVTNATESFAGTAGEMETVTVTLGVDSKIEADELISAALSNLVPVTVDSSEIDITDIATGTITNDDSATLTIANVMGNEDDGSITVTVTLDNAVDGGFDVDVSTADGTATIADSDYTAVTSQTLTFAGTAGESETFTVTPTADSIVEVDETLSVLLSNLVPVTASSSDIDITDVGTVTILNDDQATLSINDVMITEGSGGSQDLTFTVTLTGDVSDGFTVDYATADNSATSSSNDYVSESGTLNFVGTNGETQTLTISISGDEIAERDESFFVNLSNIQPGLEVTFTDSQGVGSILDNDGLIVTAAGASGQPRVRMINPRTSAEVFSFLAYSASFEGGVHVATGDVNNDGTPDIITSAGIGGGPHIKVFDGSDPNQILMDFFAFDADFRGVLVAAGDVNGDDHADIFVAAGEGSRPMVRVFSGADGSTLFDFLAYDAAFLGGVNIAAGDITGDGTVDIITAPGAGGGPHVKIFDGTMPIVGQIEGTPIADPLGNFFPYDPGFRGGVFVSAGDVNGDGHVDLITAPGVGGGPHIRVFDGATQNQLAGPLGSFFAFDAEFRGGVRVAATDFNDDGRADVVASAGIGGTPHTRIFDGASTGANPERLLDLFAPPIEFRGGLFVAGDAERESMDLLRLASGFTGSPETPLTDEAISAVFDAAVERFAAIGLPVDSQSISVEIVDLGGNRLGSSQPGVIRLDVDAAGIGWFIDPTPLDDSEFVQGKAVDGNAIGRIDLLTVFLHELGHLFGADHSDPHEPPSLMSETLEPGQRHLPRREDFEEIFSSVEFLDDLMNA